jgi:hypothetical protein
LNKFEHLIQDTKSSAMRTAINTGKILTPQDLEASPQKRTPNKMKRSSPNRLSKTIKSPLKKTMGESSTSFLLQENLNLNFDDDILINNSSSNNFDSSGDELTLEGIAGMV